MNFQLSDNARDSKLRRYIIQTIITLIQLCILLLFFIYVLINQMSDILTQEIFTSPGHLFVHNQCQRFHLFVAQLQHIRLFYSKA